MFICDCLHVPPYCAIYHLLCLHCFCLFVYTPIDVSWNGFMSSLFSLLSDPVTLAHFRHTAVRTCSSVQHSIAHASSNLSPLWFPSIHMLCTVALLIPPYLQLSQQFPVIWFSDIIWFYRSSLSRVLLVLNDADVLDCICSFSLFPVCNYPVA